MVDMSPEAVSERLRLVGELSEKLMNSMTGTAAGKCDTCEKEFEYKLINNGFNDSAYAYCDLCGVTALLSGWSANIPKTAPLKLHENISVELEKFLRPCPCGGNFRKFACPRCPHCSTELSATGAANYIERNAPGTTKGWRWQRTWDGLYAIVIEGNIVHDNWK